MSLSLLRILTYVLGLVGLSMLLPIAVAYRNGETGMIQAFAVPMIASWFAAIVFKIASKNRPRIVDVKSAFGMVGIIWVAICLFGALPMHLSGCFPSFTDALFESVSGFTTTGASVLADIEALPRSINLWRCETHWLGGMGVIALAVAVIPLLGIGGFRLIKAETTGPDKTKLTVLIATTAKALWLIYCGMTCVEALLLWYVGMDVTDAVSHAFSTMGTGGFSTRNASVGSFGLPAAEWICTAFMLLASVNFALYYRLLSGRFKEVVKDSELKALLAVVAVAITIVTAFEVRSGAFASTLRNAAFQVISVISTTGFMTADYLTWGPAAQVIIFALFFIGGSSGSTAGGIKVIRWTILAKQVRNELRRLLHPHEIFTLAINGTTGREIFIPAVASFIFIYLMLVLITAFFGTVSGLDMFTAFTAALSMVGNIGPAFGQLGPTANYGAIVAPLKWWYAFAMLAGRLEIYTIIILLGRAFAFSSRTNQRR